MEKIKADADAGSLSVTNTAVICNFLSGPTFLCQFYSWNHSIIQL